MMNAIRIREVFAEAVHETPIRLDFASLMIAKEIEYPTLDVEKNLETLDDYSHTIDQRVRDTDSTHDRLRRISEYLFDDLGFHGNSDNYYAPQNSFLNEVLEQRTGIPITLSIVFISVAKRLKLPVYGVGLPGHFIVGCESSSGPIYLDPFHDGLLLEKEECLQLARSYLSEGAVLSPSLLAPLPPPIILMRVLNNLRHIYIVQQDLPHLLSVLRLQQTLNPHNPELNRDIGILCTHLELWGEAVRQLRYYTFVRPQSKDAEKTQAMLHEAIGHLSKLN
jgi:regulator of sirC expression with transglutaminase-like and TPR domain